MGYHVFTLINQDTGYQLQAFWYDIRHVETVVIDQLMEDDFDNMAEADFAHGPKSGRFAPVTKGRSCRARRKTDFEQHPCKDGMGYKHPLR